MNKNYPLNEKGFHSEGNGLPPPSETAYGCCRSDVAVGLKYLRT